MSVRPVLDEAPRRRMPQRKGAWLLPYLRAQRIGPPSEMDHVCRWIGESIARDALTQAKDGER